MSIHGSSIITAPAAVSSPKYVATPSAPSTSETSTKRVRTAAWSATPAPVLANHDPRTAPAVTPPAPQSADTKKRKLSTQTSPVPTVPVILSAAAVVTPKDFHERVTEILGGVLTNLRLLPDLLDNVVAAEAKVAQCREACTHSRNDERVTKVINSLKVLRQAQAGVEREIESIKSAALAKIAKENELLKERVANAPSRGMVDMLTIETAKIDNLKKLASRRVVQLDALEVCVRNYVNQIDASAQKLALLYISTFDSYSPAVWSVERVSWAANALRKLFDDYRKYVFDSGLMGAIPLSADRTSRQGRVRAGG